MRIESYEQGTGKLIQLDVLDYKTGIWNIYDNKGELLRQEVMSEKQIEQFNEEQKNNREKAFKNETDAIFFQVQAGEKSSQDWVDKRAEIRERYKYIEQGE